MSSLRTQKCIYSLVRLYRWTLVANNCNSNFTTCRLINLHNHSWSGVHQWRFSCWTKPQSLYFANIQKPKENIPKAFCWGIQGDANFWVSLQQKHCSCSTPSIVLGTEKLHPTRKSAIKQSFKSEFQVEILDNIQPDINAPDVSAVRSCTQW